MDVRYKALVREHGRCMERWLETCDAYYAKEPVVISLTMRDQTKRWWNRIGQINKQLKKLYPGCRWW